jgi:hypothetical protein
MKLTSFRGKVTLEYPDQCASLRLSRLSLRFSDASA